MADKFLTEEGQRLFDSIDSYMREFNSVTVAPPELPKISPEQMEINFLRTEIARMIKNSEMVIEDCFNILSKIKTREEYIKSDAKVAISVHKNIVTRLTRVLDGQSAFEHHIKLDDE